MSAACVLNGLGGSYRRLCRVVGCRSRVYRRDARRWQAPQAGLRGYVLPALRRWSGQRTRRFRGSAAGMRRCICRCHAAVRRRALRQPRRTVRQNPRRVRPCREGVPKRSILCRHRQYGQDTPRLQPPSLLYFNNIITYYGRNNNKLWQNIIKPEPITRENISGLSAQVYSLSPVMK